MSSLPSEVTGSLKSPYIGDFPAAAMIPAWGRFDRGWGHSSAVGLGGGWGTLRFRFWKSFSSGLVRVMRAGYRFRPLGVGPGTLYRHFPTREDLLERVYRRR